MREELNDLERIEQYLLNQMNPQDKLNFELRMMGDLRLGIDANTIIHLYNGINDIGVKKLAKQVYRKQQLRKYSIIATVVVVIVTAVVLFLLSNSSVTTNEKTPEPMEETRPVKDSVGAVAPAASVTDSTKIDTVDLNEIEETVKEKVEEKVISNYHITYKKDSVIKPILKKMYIEGDEKTNNKIAL